MRRALWTIGVGLGGFVLGGMGGGTKGSILGLAWAGAIGFGFGSIFARNASDKWLSVWWSVTLSMVGPFFALLVNAAIHPDTSMEQQIGAVVAGAVIGAVLGVLVGFAQRKARAHAG